MSTEPEHEPQPQPHTISIVVPVYQGETTLPGVVAELLALTTEQVSPDGNRYLVGEVLLVHDHGPDRSADVIRELASADRRVRPVWLSRNFGQHAATLAGMASAGGEWIATLDEDGQHDPSYLGAMLDTALREQVQLVYAESLNPPPHGWLRNLASRTAKRLVTRAMGGGFHLGHVQSYRLMTGEIGRSVAAYAGPGVYLDIATGWVAGEVATCPVVMRDDSVRPSGYNWGSLLSHFWRLVLSSGTRGLRLVSITGLFVGTGGVLLALYLIGMRIFSDDVPAGWTSTVVAVLLTGGVIMVALGVVAEYLGMAVNMAMGRPMYLIVTDRQAGPLGRSAKQSAAPDADEG